MPSLRNACVLGQMRKIHVSVFRAEQKKWIFCICPFDLPQNSPSASSFFGSSSATVSQAMDSSSLPTHPLNFSETFPIPKEAERLWETAPLQDTRPRPPGIEPPFSHHQRAPRPPASHSADAVLTGVVVRLGGCPGAGFHAQGHASASPWVAFWGWGALRRDLDTSDVASWWASCRNIPFCMGSNAESGVEWSEVLKHCDPQPPSTGIFAAVFSRVPWLLVPGLAASLFSQTQLAMSAPLNSLQPL